MNGYEKLIKTIRAEANRDKKDVLQLGTMTAKKECTVGSIELDEDDLLVAEHLSGELAKGDTVLVARISEDKFIIIEKVVEI